MAIRKSKLRKLNEKFRRRKNSLLKKADELANICSVEVCVVVKRNTKFHVYRSADAVDFPPSVDDIVNHSLTK